MQTGEHFVGFREAGNSPRLGLVAAILATLIVFVAVFSHDGKAHVKETYTERTYEITDNKIIETEIISEREYRIAPEKLNAGVTLALMEMANEAYENAEKAIETEAVIEIEEKATESEEKEATVQEETIEKHYPESAYVKCAILLTGEAVGVPSLTRQSGCLWIICNRVKSEKFPDDIEEVVEQDSQFHGYTENGKYTEECYDLAVDVLERFYRECHGETADQVGRTLPEDYLYFTGDGKENYFTKVEKGEPYVWGSVYVSPYKN